MKKVLAKLAVILLAFATIVSFAPGQLFDVAYAADYTQDWTDSAGNTGITLTPTYDASNKCVKLSWSDPGNVLFGNKYMWRLDENGEQNLGYIQSGNTTFTDPNVEPEKAYMYKIVNGDKTTSIAEIVVPKPADTTPADSSGGSSGGGSSGGSSSAVPAADSYRVLAYSDVPGTAVVRVQSGSVYNVFAEVKQTAPTEKTVFKGNLGYSTVRDYTTNISYTNGGTFKYRLYYENGGKTGWKTLTVKSAKLKKPTLKATKISANKAGLGWTTVSGATGYKIYCNNKLIKKVGAKTTTYKYSKKGAGKGKYKVKPIIKSDGKTSTGPASKTKKCAPNKIKFNTITKVQDVNYANAPFNITQVSLSGNTYTITGYVVNNRIFDLKKYNTLKVEIRSNGKKVASKTYKNYKKAATKASSSKKITIKIKGKAGVDLINDNVTTFRKNESYWKTVGSKK